MVQKQVVDKDLFLAKSGLVLMLLYSRPSTISLLPSLAEKKRNYEQLCKEKPDLKKKWDGFYYSPDSAAGGAGII